MVTIPHLMQDVEDRFAEQLARVEKVVRAKAARQYGKNFLLLKTPLTEKYCAVVYRELSGEDGFVLTAYLASKPSERRKTVWKP